MPSLVTDCQGRDSTPITPMTLDMVAIGFHKGQSVAAVVHQHIICHIVEWGALVAHRPTREREGVEIRNTLYFTVQLTSNTTPHNGPFSAVLCSKKGFLIYSPIIAHPLCLELLGNRD